MARKGDNVIPASEGERGILFAVREHVRGSTRVALSDLQGKLDASLAEIAELRRQLGLRNGESGGEAHEAEIDKLRGEISDLEQARDDAQNQATDMEKQCDEAIERADAAEEDAALAVSLRAALGCDIGVAMVRAGLIPYGAVASDDPAALADAMADAIAAWIDAAAMRRAG